MGGKPVKPASSLTLENYRHSLGMGTGSVHVPGRAGSTGNRPNRPGSQRFGEPWTQPDSDSTRVPNLAVAGVQACRRAGAARGRATELDEWARFLRAGGARACGAGVCGPTRPEELPWVRVPDMESEIDNISSRYVISSKCKMN
jgi:hypothetical protein